MYQNTHHHMWWVKPKHQLRIRDASQDRQPEIQSSLVREDFQRIMEQTNNYCRFQILIPHVSNVRLLEDKIQDWGMYLFTISYGSYAVDQRSGVGWISGWSKKSSRSISRNSWMPDFLSCSTRKLLQHWTKSFHNTRFKKKVSLEEMKAQKEDRFLQGRQIAYLIYEYFRVTGSNDSVENNADLFSIVLRNDDIQEFDSIWTEFYYQWRKSHLMTSWKDCTN